MDRAKHEEMYQEFGVESVEIETTGYKMWDRQGRRLIKVHSRNLPRSLSAVWQPIEDAILSPAIGVMVEQSVAKECDRRERLGKTFELRKSVS